MDAGGGRGESNPRGVRVQAPLVDSVTCYCRVDAGLKTVVGARKFVPGAKLCIQPDIKPNRAKSRSSRKERSRNQAPLLPGLPDDLAVSCLIRVPRVEHQNLRLAETALKATLFIAKFFKSNKLKASKNTFPSEYEQADKMRKAPQW
ncbi:hypothetical protein J5N97_010510 [Dioscorea zingiberensis]|uniref:Uncharacterized protein n=1 Tax=Dioscorea zingiberensis TaxID=325984 RepID=A0A9D5D1D3_9LILI|nr:hypothetical protein J5N97_010510 [Dioscorea zingiberensis]